MTLREAEARGGRQSLDKLHRGPEPALGQAPGLRPQPGVPFVLQCPVPERGKRTPGRGNLTLHSRQSQTHAGHGPCLLGGPVCSLLRPGSLAAPCESSQHLPFAGLQASVSLEAWPAFKQGRSGVVLGGPQTLEEMEEGRLQRPWQGQRKETCTEDESLLTAILTRPLRPVQGAQCLVPATPPSPAPPQEERPGEGATAGLGPGSHPWSRISLLPAPPSCCETKQAPSVGEEWGLQGPLAPQT